MYQYVSTNPGVRHPLLRRRYQLLGGMLFATGVPLLVRMAIEPRVLMSPGLQQTLFAAAIAHLLGYFLYRRLGTFPGLSASSYILPTFALTYGAVFFIFFLFRLDYTRFQAIGSFVGSIVWYFSVNALLQRLEPYRLAIIPEGNVDRLKGLRNVNWHVLTSPGAPFVPVQGVVADLRADLPASWERFITQCVLSGIPVYHVKQIMESLTGRVEIEHLSENTLGSLNPNQAYLQVKQIVDWITALAVLTLVSPVLLMLAIAIRLESPGPALFKQRRVGYRGKVFTVYKFRTMRQEMPEGASATELAITRVRDPRITRIGRFLRRTRIDELPQLFNILRGEMSWIGPRPEAEVLSRWYDAELPFYPYRHIVRPGITGWAQVNQGHVAAVDQVLEKLHYDFYYIKNISPWLDLVIIMRTIRIMITGYGAK